MMLFSAFTATIRVSSHYYHSASQMLSPPQNLLPLLQLSIAQKSLRLTQQFHARIFPLGFSQNPFSATKLISAYAICGAPTESQLVFYSLQGKSVYLWNSLINGYVKNQEFREAFRRFNQMGCRGFLPDDYTLATLSKVSAETGELNPGKLVHGKSVKVGFVLDVVVANSLMSMYNKCGKFGNCLKLFDEMPQRNVSSWNIVMAGYADSGDFNFHNLILGFIEDMQIEGFKPDAFTISCLLRLCSKNAGMWNVGRELHGFIVRNELGLNSGSDVHLGCGLIDMYFRRNKIDAGRRVFNKMKSRNVYVYTAMINGYVLNGALDEALVLFREMQVRHGIEPNEVSLVSVLPACSSFAGLINLKQIHGYAIRKELTHHLPLCNSLIDMYSKCGSLNYASRIFDDGCFCRDAVSWSSMISGYGLHGKGKQAIIVYNNMLELGNKPDRITLLGVLSACCRSGLLDEGLHIYGSAINKHGIKPTVEICACVVDMLGRSGQLERALDFIKTMPMEPVPSVWGALVSASIMHGNSKMQDLAYKILMQLEPENPSNYVSLANLHASSRRWEVVAEVRRTMKEKGLRKTPGCSWININSTTDYFYAADKVHPCSESIYEILDGLIWLMKGASHSPEFDNFA